MATTDEMSVQYKLWTSDMAESVQPQGWDLFDYDNRGMLQIQKDDEMEIFATDSDAIEFVKGRAAEGDETAKLALSLHNFFDPIIYPEAPTVEEERSFGM